MCSDKKEFATVAVMAMIPMVVAPELKLVLFGEPCPVQMARLNFTYDDLKQYPNVRIGILCYGKYGECDLCNP